MELNSLAKTSALYGSTDVHNLRMQRCSCASRWHNASSADSRSRLHRKRVLKLPCLLSGRPVLGSRQSEQAYRTGRLAHLKREVFKVHIEDKQPCVFVEPGVIEQLQAMTAH